MLVQKNVNEDLVALFNNVRFRLNAEQINNTVSFYVHIKDETYSER